MNIKRFEPYLLIIGTLFLLYAFTFALVNILKYNLGFSNLWNPYAFIVDSANPTLLTNLLALLIIVAPAIALLFFFLPLLQVEFNRNSETIVTIHIQKGSKISLLLIEACLFVGALFTLYFLAENFGEFGIRG